MIIALLPLLEIYFVTIFCQIFSSLIFSTEVWHNITVSFGQENDWFHIIFNISYEPHHSYLSQIFTYLSLSVAVCVCPVTHFLWSNWFLAVVLARSPGPWLVGQWATVHAMFSAQAAHETIVQSTVYSTCVHTAAPILPLWSSSTCFSKEQHRFTF